MKTAIRTFQGKTPETSDVVLCHYCGESLHDPENDIEWEQAANNHYCKPMLKVRVAELEALLHRAADAIETDGARYVVQDIRAALKEAK